MGASPNANDVDSATAECAHRNTNAYTALTFAFHPTYPNASFQQETTSSRSRRFAAFSQLASQSWGRTRRFTKWTWPPMHWRGSCRWTGAFPNYRTLGWTRCYQSRTGNEAGRPQSAGSLYVARPRAAGKMVALSPFEADPIQLARFRGLKAIPVTIHVSAVAVVPAAISRSASRIL